MAHNIHYNEDTNKHSFFSVKEKPWHGLGQVVKDYVHSSKVIEQAGLDFTVEKRSLFTSKKSFHSLSDRLIIDSHVATVRTDTEEVLGVVGKSYQTVQNRDVFSFFDAIVKGEGILYETAGALGCGYFT